ncbi:DNA repair protein XRCC4 isoform X2 [Boleophthalmus pectinirostris]|uniref:DNA repair protein XRCC4 isoform X2 n=1 Tax=Boleophthalmus pectinirostris TaxID=150288 RepID=UPI000A1C5378|nr:DNA repair protein XRCC4 isoform X2 [Boleophthalmus pectinirostris]
MHTSVRQISLSGSSYFLRLDWGGPDLGSGFRLLLTDAKDAWRGEVTEAAICEEAKELEMKSENYVQDIHQALIGTESSTSYTFTLNCSSAHVSLAYEKVQKDISFRLGSVALTALSDPAEAVRELLIYSMDKANSLERYNRKLEEQNQRLNQEHQRITAQLKQYVSGKKALELELYSRFVHVLNEKKAKIRSLFLTLTSLQEERSSYGKTDQTQHSEHNDEDEYGGSTEDETEEAEPKPAEKTPAEVEANECTTPSPLDDGLSDLIDVAPCRKRRYRHLDTPAPRPSKSHTYKKRRSESPAAPSVKQAPHCPTDAAAATSDAEDLFEDF